MPIAVGAKLPSDVVGFVSEDGLPVKRPLSDLVAGKKVVIFGIPGAFTRTCTKEHLPGFATDFDALTAKGVDSVICLATNDVFVLDAWNKANGDERITMLSDGNGDITRALDLGLDSSARGLGFRTTRFAMIADDGVVKALEVEEQASQCSVSAAANILAKL